MEEKQIIKGELKDSKLFCLLLPVAGLIAAILYDFSVANDYYFVMRNDGYPDYAYAFSFDNGANLILYPLIIALAFFGYFIYKRWSQVQITITDKRVFGYDALGKRVDLPLDSVTAVGTSILSGLAVTTASGAIKFVMLRNRDELHEAISKLLVERQDTPTTTTIKQEIPQSNADELQKYKKLLDSGIISQEEFDAKKKQLLGI